MRDRLPYYKSTILSPREVEIYNLLLQGKQEKEIASLLIVAPCTVRTHMSVIYQKKFVNSQEELMALRIKELEERINELTRTTNRAGKENDSMFCG